MAVDSGPDECPVARADVAGSGVVGARPYGAAMVQPLRSPATASASSPVARLLAQALLAVAVPVALKQLGMSGKTAVVVGVAARQILAAPLAQRLTQLGL